VTAPLQRVVRIVFRPAAEWESIAREPSGVATMLFGYVMPLALIPAAATAIGMTFFGTDWDAVQGYRVGSGRALHIALGNYLLVVASVVMLAAILRLLGKTPGRPRPTYRQCVEIAAYGATPLLLAGALLFLPMLVTGTLVAAMHSLYVLSGGIRRILGIAPSDSAMLVGISVIAMVVASMALGAVVAALGLIDL
jgi:hypothetical protein